MKKTLITYSSSFLFPDSDFATGMGSTLNIAGNYFEFATSESELAADKKALLSDWGLIGQDIKQAADNSGIDYRNEKVPELICD
jgi:hypothetical protein